MHFLNKQGRRRSGQFNQVICSRLFGREAIYYVLFGNSMYISTRRGEALFFTQRLLQLSLRYICLPISSSGRPFISFPALHQQDPPITSTVIICLFVSSQRRPVIPPTHSIPLSTTQIFVRPHTHPVEHCPNLILESPYLHTCPFCSYATNLPLVSVRGL